MAIIELNLEKPALKRVESGEEKRVEEKEIEAEVNPEEAAEMMDEETAVEIEDETDEGSKSRVGKYARRLLIVGGAAVGILTARKFRQRRKSKSQEQELEEDWQTAE
ncbi:hypothetical protein [Halorussus caseinilyticus]|uniref:hypothetical protein n=1 Tax=Halorussus caseinilyticus TaxID=3034025 RepID=UPI0023E7BAC1|nr:hypothetical protein [Halorussus sp. DT72]